MLTIEEYLYKIRPYLSDNKWSQNLGWMDNSINVSN